MEMQVSYYMWAILMGGSQRGGVTGMTEAERAGPSLKFTLAVGS